MITLQKNKAFVRNLCTEIFSKRNRFIDQLVLTEEKIVQHVVFFFR